jgi:hypothetical protein
MTPPDEPLSGHHDNAPKKSPAKPKERVRVEIPHWTAIRIGVGLIAIYAIVTGLHGALNPSDDPSPSPSPTVTVEQPQPPAE